MALPQHLTYGRGGTIHLDVPSLPDAVTVSILDADGGTKLEHTAATVSTIDTTLSANVSAGDLSVSVDSNVGFETGKTVWLRDDPEEILVRAVEGTTIRLRRPVIYDHVSGAGVEGARVSYDVNASVSNTLWWDGRAEWNVDDSLYFSSVECGRYPNRRLASTQDLYDCEPKLYDILDTESDVERMLDNAHEVVLGELAKRAPDQRARVFTGSMEFRSATAAAAMYLHYLRRGSELKEDWWKEFERRLAACVTTTPRDADQDGVIEPGEAFSYGSIRLRR